MPPRPSSVDDAEAASEVIRLGLPRGLLCPEKVVEGGILTVDEVERLSDSFLAERDAARAIERLRHSLIVEVAQELQLDPDTDGSPGMWEANCPTRPHRLLLQTSTDLFCCGYCQVGGGPDELRALVAERHRNW